MAKKFKFVDVQKLHRDIPSLDVPDENEIKNIEVGDYVKISNGKERFWVEITESPHAVKDKKQFTGIVKNNLLESDNYDIGDKINLRPRNIYKINKKRE